MTELEEQTIAAIIGHPHLKQEDKAKYAAALLLMTPKKQAEFAELFKKFQDRCDAIASGEFMLTRNEAKGLAAAFQNIKKLFLLKFKNNPA